MNELLAWLHPESSEQLVRAPAETMLLKSKPYFVRCRELKIQVSHNLVVRSGHMSNLCKALYGLEVQKCRGVTQRGKCLVDACIYYQ